MKLRRTSLALVTATAVALSILPATSGAQESANPTTVTAAPTVDEDVDRWPGSAEGSSMLLDGDIPTAPEFGSSSASGGKTNDKEEEEDKDGDLVNENGEIPVIGSITLPGWVAIPIGILQGAMVITTFMAQAAYAVLPLLPNGTQILRDWLISVGINPDA